MRAKELVVRVENLQKGRQKILDKEKEDAHDMLVWRDDILVRRCYWEELKKKVNGE